MFTQNPQVCSQFQEEVDKALATQQTQQGTVSAEARFGGVRDALESAATKTVGYKKRAECSRKAHDPGIALLSAQQKELRVKIDSTKCPDGRKSLKRNRNQILHQIRDIARNNSEARLDSFAQEVEKLKNNARVFQAASLLRRQSPAPLVVHDALGRIIANDKEAAEKVADHFRQQFRDPSAVNDILRPLGSKYLEDRISAAEVALAIRLLKSQRAAGPDGIPGDLFKHAGERVAHEIAAILNQCFADGSGMDLGCGTLIPLPKPGKPRGPLTSIRPIILLNSIRKCLSTITLRRIMPKIDSYLSPTQSASRPGRSTADIVWCGRWLAAKAERFKWQCTVLGMDMSKAFDTVQRGRLVEVMKQIVNTDEVRMVEMLLHNTRLRVKIKNALSAEFPTSIGIPQGDSLSPVLFTCYLEATMRCLRPRISPRPAILNIGGTAYTTVDMSIPCETAYMDDVNLYSTDRQHLACALTEAEVVFKEWNLNINPTKTEWTHLYQEEDVARRGEERWRSTRLLGSLYGVTEDLKRRRQQAAAAFNTLVNLWMRRQVISEATRLRLFDAFVLSILTYNCGVWVLSSRDATAMDAFHRKQLRRLLGISYPEIISNTDLYARCNAEPISVLSRRARWKLFGHILRLPEATPAQVSMTAYFQRQNRGWLGRPRITLPVVIDNELAKATSMRLRSLKDLETLRLVARNRQSFNDIIAQVTL